MPVAMDVFGVSIVFRSASLASQSSSFSSARMTFRSRYTFALQPLLEIFMSALHRLVVDSLQALLPNNQLSAVPQRFGPRAEDAILDKSA